MSSFGKRIAFVCVNAWLVWHVFAIAISPASMPPASPLLTDASTIARPYNQALFLNHGYHYFAPNPGSSSLLEFSTRPENDIPPMVRIPDPEDYFPRLRYHRFFMLSENVWAFGEEPQRQFIEAYARHFAKRLNSTTVDVTAVSHDPAPMSRIVAGGDLVHPSSYFREPLATFEFASDGTTVSNSFQVDSEPVASVSFPDDSPIVLTPESSLQLDTASAAANLEPADPLSPIPHTVLKPIPLLDDESEDKP